MDEEEVPESGNSAVLFQCLLLLMFSINGLFLL